MWEVPPSPGRMSQLVGVLSPCPVHQKVAGFYPGSGACGRPPVFLSLPLSLKVRFQRSISLGKDFLKSHIESAEPLSRDLTGRAGKTAVRGSIAGWAQGVRIQTVQSPVYGVSFHWLLAQIHLSLRGSVSRQNCVCLRLGAGAERAWEKSSSICIKNTAARSVWLSG